MSLNGPSLTGLRRVLAEDRNFARIQAEAARGFAARSEDYQISAPAGMRSTLLAEMADGLTTHAAETGSAGVGRPGAGGPGRHGHRPRGRGPDRGPASLSAGRLRGRVPQLGDPAA